MEKNWTGDRNSIYKTLGASNHTKEDREVNDYYATSPSAGEMLLELETLNENIWEPACGQGHLSKVFEKHGHNVLSSDLVYRGYGKGSIDFLKQTKKFNGDIVTNPPYKYAKEFVEKALELVYDGNKVVMFLKVLFLESKGRKPLFEKYPPKTVYISSNRIECGKNGNFKGDKAVAYAWYMWEKGFNGTTQLKWF